MLLEWTVRVGDIIAAVTFIIGGLGAYYAIKSDVRVLRHDFANMKTAVDLLATAVAAFGGTLTKVAVQDERIKNIENDIREMKHGDGFVGVQLKSTEIARS